MARRKIDRKDKKCFLEFVWLAPSEYAHLEQLLGKAELERWIVELNGYIGSKDGKDPYGSHYYTIQNWARRTAKAKAAATAPDPRPLPRMGEGEKAADYVIEQLKKNPPAYMPTDEKIRPVLHAMLTARKQNWPQLRAFLKENPEKEAAIREEFVKVYLFADGRR